jgi:hypothetical protein
MDNYLGIHATEAQLKTTINLLGSLVSNLKGRLPETHSGVDRLMIESVIIDAENLIAHYTEFLPENNTEPEEKPIEVEG